ncbi:MAG: hypothetical protein ACTSRZ_01150 [Promethearchaeota archaeon]
MTIVHAREEMKILSGNKISSNNKNRIFGQYIKGSYCYSTSYRNFWKFKNKISKKSIRSFFATFIFLLMVAIGIYTSFYNGFTLVNNHYQHKDIDVKSNFILKNSLNLESSNIYLEPSIEPPSNMIGLLSDKEHIIIDGYFFDWAKSDVLKIDSPNDRNNENNNVDSSGLDIIATYSRVDFRKLRLFIRIDFVDISRINWAENFILILVDLDGNANANIREVPNNIALIEILSNLNLLDENINLDLVDCAIIISDPSEAQNNNSNAMSNLVINREGDIKKIEKINYSTIVGSLELSIDLKASNLSKFIFGLPIRQHPLLNIYTFKSCNCADKIVSATIKAFDISEEDNGGIVATEGINGFVLEDEIKTMRSLQDPISSQEGSQSSSVKIAFIHHGNQPYRATDWNGNPDWIQGIIYDPNGVVDHDNGIADGYHYSLKAHEDYNIPLDLELTATLLSGIQYEDTEFLERIKEDIQQGLVQIVGTVYAQQKLPYYPEDMNEWAINTSKNMIRQIIDPNNELNLPLNVMWVPDRTWKDLPNVILPVSRHYSAIVLDDRPHFDDFGGSEDYHEPHLLTSSVSEYWNNLTVFFICTTFRDHIFQPDTLRSHWASLASQGNPNIVCLYGDDWEKSCGNGFFDNKDDYATYYRNSLQNIAAIPWVEPVTLTEITQNITAGDWPLNYNITVISDTAPYIDGNGYYGMADDFYYGMTGYHDEYNHYDYWYKVWKNWVPNDINPYFSYTTKNLEQLWQDAHNALYNSPINNRLIELGKHILAASQHETAFGAGEDNWGNERLFDWQKRQSEHARYGNVFAYAAEWANGAQNGSIGISSLTEQRDVDNDGVNEYILMNKYVLAIFDIVGGKLQWLFGNQNNYPVLLAGNSIVFYDGNDYHTGGVESGFGDYNDYGHQYCLSDSRVSKVNDDQPFDYDLNYVSQPRSQYDKLRLDNYSYTLTFYPISGGVRLNSYCAETGLSKNITLKDGSWDLEINYNTGGNKIYVFNGFTPNLLSLIYSGKNLNITNSNNSFIVENTNYPAKIGIKWNDLNTNLTYTESLLFEERAEIVGEGNFSFNITTAPPSPIRIYNISNTQPEIGKNVNITANIYSLVGTNITAAKVFYRIFNGSWSDYKNISMNLVSGTTTLYKCSLPSDVTKVGNSVEFYIYAEDDDIPKNSRFSNNITISGSEPLYHVINIDGINDFKQQEKIASDPAGDSGDLQVDFLDLYTSWDAEKIYFGINISSSTNLMEWGGSNPASVFMVIDSIEDSGYSNVSNTVYGDMWNRAIKYNDTNLPDFELHATLNINYPYIEYSIFNNSTKSWSAGNTTGVEYAYAATTIGIFMEIAIDWSCLYKTGNIMPTINVSAGICGGYDGDSAIDSVPNDPATNHLDNGANEWVDDDVFDTERFVTIEWDSNNDSVPDFLPAEINIVQPLNGSTVSGIVSMEIEATASLLANFLNVSLNSSIIHSVKCSSNKGSAKFLWDSTEVRNGFYVFQVKFELSDFSIVIENFTLYVLNKYETSIKFSNPLGNQQIFGDYDKWTFIVKVEDKYGDPVKSASVSAFIQIITYEDIIVLQYITLTNDSGECTIEIPLTYAASYLVTINASHSSYKSSIGTISLQVINKYPTPDYTMSFVLFSVGAAIFIMINIYWIYSQIKKGGFER